MTSGPAPEMRNRDGHSFAYILHYLITGDLIYPLHEGFHRVDALLNVINALSNLPVNDFSSAGVVFNAQE